MPGTLPSGKTLESSPPLAFGLAVFFGAPGMARSAVTGAVLVHVVVAG